MADFYYDTEFLEGTQKKRFLGIPYGETKPTVDLISIGIVAEDGREYYAISKDFNLKEAWNRFQWKTTSKSSRRSQGKFSNKEHQIKEYWIRENVLKPIFKDLWKTEKGALLTNADWRSGIFNYKSFKEMIEKYGKTNKQIAFEIMQFTLDPADAGFTDWLGSAESYINALKEMTEVKPQFYGYYSAYDHVALCWLFGKMIDLPKSFPMYTKDLKQMLDEKVASLDMYYARDVWGNGTERFMQGDLQEGDRHATLSEKLKGIKLHHPDYPKQINAHNALDDAIFCRKLHQFIKAL